MNISGETVLSWSAILFFLLLAAFLNGSSFEGEPISTHFDAVAIGLLIAGCAAGTLLGFLLFRREYQALYRKVVLGDWLWRWLAGLYT
jgi:Zn-dependent protease with chaperone function